MDNLEEKNPPTDCRLDAYDMTEGGAKEARNIKSTPLHMTAMLGHIDVHRLIMENNEGRDPPRADGATTLHIAAKYGHYDMCKYLLENMEDKNPVNEFGFTPHRIALRHNHTDVAQLLEHSAKSKVTRRKKK